MDRNTFLAFTVAGMLILMLSGCGGGAAPTSTCTLGAATGCGGSGSPPPATLPEPPATQPTTPPLTSPEPVAPVTPVTPATPPVVPVTPPATPAAPETQATSLSLVFSASELPSAGGEATVTALVKNAANAALAGAKVTFSADSGILGASDSVTDSKGQARVTLGSGESRANRAIAVSARSGAAIAGAAINVTGTALTLSAPALLGFGKSADITASLRDSAGQPIAGAALTASTGNGNALSVKSGGASVTDSQGQLILKLQADKAGAETVGIAGQGATAARTLTIDDTDMRIAPAMAADADGNAVALEVATGFCQPIDVRYARQGVGQAGMVRLTTSRGKIYADRACQNVLNRDLALKNGDMPRVYVTASDAGVAAVTAAIINGPSAATRIEFIAPLTTLAKLSLQAQTATLSSNNNGSAQDQRSVLSAIVRDGTRANNLVKGAAVTFTILSDPSGGQLLPPYTARTGSDGVAQATYIAGQADSGRDGVVLQAQLQDGSRATASTKLTVARKALSIQFGTGNNTTVVSPSLLQQQFSVLVSDAAGNAVPGVSVSAAAWATRYAKGSYKWIPRDPAALEPGIWQAFPTATCANEDRARKGIYEAAYDTNNNGVLDPGIPVTVTVGDKTDALGLTELRLNYPRDRGNWVEIALTVRGAVAGTEASASTVFWLPALVSDLDKYNVAPPGAVSPYGSGDCGIAN
ncbi:MAG: Ig-like domain-containing protein [Pseudomonadota bacterium]